MSQEIRVRFAPSPTGPLHIGGVRTALFNYLFAKKNGGQFILRIEDTDRNRFVESAEQYIIDSLNWCGLPFDEGPGKEGAFGPYRQSERKHLYQKYVDQLLQSGKAYYAFDTNDQLDLHRKEHETKGKTFIYNWHNRLKLDNSLSLPIGEVKERMAAGEEYVVRFLTPVDQKLLLKDTIRGDIEIDTNTLDDKVLFKSDGMPTYHLANIVDDHLMQITHVIRGEEWLPSLALHQQLYDAFGWSAPQFAHLPLILKPTGTGKLSKRDGDKMGFPVFPLSWKDSIGYRDAGYFPEAVVNFLALLGWNPGTEQEIFSLDQLVQTFSLERVHKSGARFDPDKIKWYNQHYLQEKDNAVLAEQFKASLADMGLDSLEINDTEFLKKVVSLIKERATFVSDFWELGEYFFRAPHSYNEAAVKKQWKTETPELLNRLVSFIGSILDFSSENIEAQVKTWLSQENLPFGKVLPVLRLTIVGDMKGAHIFDILAAIGKEETIRRIHKAIDTFQTP